MKPINTTNPAAVIKRVIPLCDENRSKFLDAGCIKFFVLMSFPPKGFLAESGHHPVCESGRWRVSSFVGITKWVP
jgi:hypothetical protein